ncbi:MAG TPA: hypothetical protein VF346_01340, partial [Bacteroidales bacterium]
MRSNRYLIFLSVLTFALILMALAAESVYFSDFEYRFRTKMFNKTLAAKETILEDCLNEMKPILASEKHHGSITENKLFSIAEKNRISILEYVDNKLWYWSDNEFDVPVSFMDSLYNKPLVFFQNGWFLPKTVQARGEKIIGLLRLHTDFGFENNNIKSGFEKEYGLPENVDFSIDKGASEFHVFNKEGDFLFSIMFPAVKGNSCFILIPLCLWAAAFILIILLTLELAKLLDGKGKGMIGIGLTLSVFTIIYLIILLTGKPLAIFQTELFSPYRFSLDNTIPSLGHLLMLGILAVAFSTVLYRYFPVKEMKESKSAENFLFLLVLLMTGALILSVYQWIFSQLISTSNMNFETYKVLELNIFSFAGYTSGFLLLLVPVFYLLKIFQYLKFSGRDTVICSLIASVTLPALFFHNKPGTLIPLAIFYFILVISIWISTRKKLGLFNKTVIFSLITGVYFLYFITILSEEKTTANIKIQAVSFSAENDPEAEHLLLDLWPAMEKDTTLNNMMKAEQFDKENFDKIFNYVQDTYFTGFWKNYHFNLWPCQNDQPLEIGTGTKMTQNCFSFFDDRIKKDGHRLTGTNFYFIDNQGGRSYYLGRSYYKSGRNKTNGLFIELYSDVNVFQPGYSELLLDKKYHGYAG